MPTGTYEKPRSAGVCARQGAHGTAHHVVGGVQDGHRAGNRRQVRQHPELGGRIGLEALVPRQVVGRDVEDDGHVRREERGGRQLVGRHLGHVHLHVAGRHGLETRVADVADRLGRQARRPQHVGRERHRGRLAVGARHGHPARVLRAFAPGELHLAHDLRAGRGRAFVERGELRDAGAGDAQVEGAFHLFAAELHARAERAQALGEGAGVLAGRARHHAQLLHAAAQKRRQVPGRRAPALAEPQNKHAPQTLRRVLPSFDESARGHHATAMSDSAK